MRLPHQLELPLREASDGSSARVARVRGRTRRDVALELWENSTGKSFVHRFLEFFLCTEAFVEFWTIGLNGNLSRNVSIGVSSAS